MISPSSKNLCILIWKPHSKHHIEDTLDNKQPDTWSVIEVCDRWIWPFCCKQWAELLTTLHVPACALVEQGRVQRTPHMCPLTLWSIIGEEEQDVCSKQIGHTSLNACKGWGTPLLGLCDLTAFLVLHRPKALSMPIMVTSTKSLPLPNEERQATFAVGNESHKASNDISPPCRCQDARSATLCRSHARAAQPLRNTLAAVTAQNEECHECLAETSNDALYTTDGESKPHAKNWNPGCISSHILKRCPNDRLNVTPISFGFTFRHSFCHLDTKQRAQATPNRSKEPRLQKQPKRNNFKQVNARKYRDFETVSQLVLENQKSVIWPVHSDCGKSKHQTNTANTKSAALVESCSRIHHLAKPEYQLNKLMALQAVRIQDPYYQITITWAHQMYASASS